MKRVSFNAALRSPVLWFSISAVILALVVATTGPPMPPLAVQRGIGALYRHKYKEALELLTPYAEGGDTTAQFTLATMSSSGWGVTRSDSEAFKWYRRAANGGSRLAQVGIFYKNSRTVTKDDAEAAKWFRLAAERGEAEAQYDLGIMYETGRGVPQDIHEAASCIGNPLRRRMLKPRTIWPFSICVATACSRTSLRRANGSAKPRIAPTRRR